MKSTLHAAIMDQSINARVSAIAVLEGWFNKAKASMIQHHSKKFLFLLLSFCSAYLSSAQTSCTIEPKFEWRPDTVNCKKIWFINQSEPISPNVRFTWKFGDGSSSNEISPAHVYNQPGTYNVCLIIDAGNNCVKEICKAVVVNCDTCALQVDFKYEKEPSQPNRIYFQSLVTNPPGTVALYAWSFGDGQGSDSGNPTHIYANPGTYNACLKIYINNTCFKEVCKTIVIGDSCQLQVDFNYEKEPSQPNRIYFQSFVTAPPGTNPLYLWSFGDGTTSDAGNPTHIYANPGSYNACLKITLNNGCIKEVCKTIVIGGGSDSCRLEVKWRSEADPNHPRRIKFFNETIVPSAGADYKWTFGDGTGSSDKDPVHIYEKAGEYKVCLKVAISNTCIRELCRVIVVDTPCRLEAKFEFRIDSLQKNKVIFLNRTVSNQTTIHYLWKFGDGTTSNDINPTHIYQQPGIYEVCLVAETNNGCRSVYCAKVEIRSVICPIEPKFEWRASQEDPRKIYFKNLTILPSPLVHYLWKFGDGTTSTEKDPVHIYEKPGEYEVCLIVEIGDFCRKVTCQKIVISVPSCNVDAKFEWKQDAHNWKKIWFQNHSQPVSNIWKTYWYYGDGTTSQDFNSFHEYTNAGKYYVCLKVVSLNGCIDSYCDSVIVRRKDSCDNRSGFKWETAGNNQLELKFKPEHINTTWKYIWKFGDGTGSTAVTPVHKFEKPGTYNVCLTVIQSNGCQTTTCKEIKVGPACENAEVKFEYKRDEQRPNKISFKAKSNQHILKQKWTIKRDSTINGFPYTVVLHQNNPTFIFPFAGWYTVCLEATLANGCIKKYCERINIERVVLGAIVNNLSVFPNPARSTARIQLKMESIEQISVTVMDEAGAVKYQMQVGGQSGNNTINLPVDKLSQGQYLVQLRYGNQVRWARFQKM